MLFKQGKSYLQAFLLASFAVCGCETVRRAEDVKEALACAGEERSWVLPAGEAPSVYDSSLRDFVEFAISNRPEIISKRLAVDDARLALKQIRADAPVLSTSPWGGVDVSASGGYSASSTPSSWIKKKTRGNAAAAISLDLLLWDFGRNDARAKAACERVVAAECEYAEACFSVFSETAAAWASYFEKEALLDAAVSEESEYAARLDREEKKIEIGEGRKLDVLRARLDLASARESTVSASNDLAVAKAEFLHSLGAIAFDCGGEQPENENPGALAKGFADGVANEDEIFALSLTNSPAMAVTRARFRAASADVDAAVADLYPEISASLSLNWTDPLWYWRWGVNAVQQIFTGWKKTAAVDRAVVALKIAAADVAEKERSLALAVSTAVTERDSAREALVRAETSMKEAMENLATVKKELEIGEADRIDFSQAVSAYTKAAASRASAFYRAERAKAAIFAISGTRPEYNERKDEETKNE